MLAEITLHFNKICMYNLQIYICDVYAHIYANFSNPFISAYLFFFYTIQTEGGGLGIVYPWYRHPLR